MTTEIRLIEAGDRGLLKNLLRAKNPEHAMAAYYALEQDSSRAVVAGAFDGSGYPLGLSVSSMTGMDLFRRVINAVAYDPSILNSVLMAVLTPAQAAVLYLSKDQMSWLSNRIRLSDTISTEILQLTDEHFQPVINVLVVEQTTPDGSPRYEIRSQQGIQAAAGVNWIGARTAEIYVEATEAARKRGFARSVVAALAGKLIGENRIPFVRVDEADPSLKMEVQRVGFRPTGFQQIIAGVTLIDEDLDQAGLQ